MDVFLELDDAHTLSLMTVTGYIYGGWKQAVRRHTNQMYDALEAHCTDSTLRVESTIAVVADG